jgi:hypothetical protein
MSLEPELSIPRDDESVSKKHLSEYKPGLLGLGTNTLSPSNIKTTDDIVGLSSGCCWTHKRPIWIHFKIDSWVVTWSSSNGSINSMALFSFQSFHA